MSAAEDLERFAIGLARALGAVHAAVGLTLLAPGRVPVVLAVLVGGGAFLLTGRARKFSPRQAGALGYAGPMLGVAMLWLGVKNPADHDAALRDLLAFFWAVGEATPAPAYFLATFYGLATAKGAAARNPFDPP